MAYLPYDPSRTAFATLTHDKKTGRVYATHAAKRSCGSCALKDAGCYGDDSFEGLFVWPKLNQAAAAKNATRLDIAQEEARAIRALPGKNRPLRVHIVGDCATTGAALEVSGAVVDWQARGGGPAWAYTHAWRVVARRAWRTTSTLASCETEEDIRAAEARGYAAALEVERFPSRKAYRMRDGGLGIPCPAQTHENVTCESCRLCFNDGALRARRARIVFEAHGSPRNVKKARATLARAVKRAARKEAARAARAALESGAPGIIRAARKGAARGARVALEKHEARARLPLP